jgi:hypothetical protein
MGLFDELDVASAADDPFGVPDDMYEAVVEKVEVKVSNDKTYHDDTPVKGLSITYKITEGDYAGEKVSEYKYIPKPVDKNAPTADERRSMSFLKQRLLSLGVPESRINSFEPDDVVGADVYVTTKKNGNYTNITDVKVNNGSAAAVEF